jgi:DNA-binding XRE family transcriptional regulator
VSAGIGRTQCLGVPIGGYRAAFYREQAGMTQEQLAARVNVSHDVISKIETGYRPPGTSRSGWTRCLSWIRARR